MEEAQDDVTDTEHPRYDPARAWLKSLHPERQPEIDVWMRMNPQEFQGRVALALADIRDEQAWIRTELCEMRRPVWQSLARGIGIAVGAAITTIAALMGAREVQS